uniref:Uncharacterized protein n=1 Tax=Cacopsylla melanoneura TaxID=428564 RepID=A0A8D8RMD9_9HEMI
MRQGDTHRVNGAFYLKRKTDSYIVWTNLSTQRGRKTDNYIVWTDLSTQRGRKTDSYIAVWTDLSTQRGRQNHTSCGRIFRSKEERRLIKINTYIVVRVDESFCAKRWKKEF